MEKSKITRNRYTEDRESRALIKTDVIYVYPRHILSFSSRIILMGKKRKAVTIM